MRYLTVDEVLKLQHEVIARSGGAFGVLNMNAVESAVAQPEMTFGGEELYPSLVEKSSALGFTLINNHPFMDGNKRIGHAAMETFLVLNGCEIQAPVDEQEQVILAVASGELRREAFTQWLEAHVVPRTADLGADTDRA